MSIGMSMKDQGHDISKQSSSHAHAHASLATVKISLRAAEQIKRGMLWIYSNEVKDKKSIHESGEWCFFEHQAAIVGTGYFNPHSLISGRVVASGREENIETLITKRLKSALARRDKNRFQESIRAVYSESDLLPGLIADWFSGALVIQSNTAGVDRQLPFISATLTQLIESELGTPVKAIVHRQDSAIRTLEGLPSSSHVEKGNEEEIRRWAFQEAGITYSADLLDGQKTGFFLDQRENRDFLESWVKTHPNSRVLDLFCYSGGWGMRALKSGASYVEFVDQSQQALDLVKSGAEKNNFSSDRLKTVKADAFDYLSTSLDTFDVVVADPPAFLKSKKDLPQARKAYEKLVRLCWRRVKSGGVLLISSCSFHLSESDFLELVRDSIGREEGLAHLIYRGKQGADHPMLMSMPETRYLKCVGLQKISV